MEYQILMLFKALRIIKIFNYITLLGDTKVLLFIICAVYWKNSVVGIELIKTTLMAGNVSQIAKLVFCIPRPFTIYKNINPSKFALKTATGYSFPSGHSQGSMSVFGFLANKYNRNILYAIPFLVAISRLVLGVHTPTDVIIGLIIGLIFIRLNKGNLFVIDLISLLLSIFKYTKGTEFMLIKDDLMISILTLLFIIIIPYIQKPHKLSNKKILIGLIPLAVVLLIIKYFNLPTYIFYILFLITMFVYPKKAVTK